MKKFLMRTLTIQLMAFSMLVSCVASPRDDVKKFFETQKEDGYGDFINDSIASIMLDAKSITCELQSKNPVDTLRQDTVAKLLPQMKSVIRYLFFDKANFQTDDVVYGIFDSWACFKFKIKKNVIVSLEMDFGLKKWRLLDANGEMICMRDMKENNMQFLHFTRMLFPKDETLRILNENFNTIEK